MWCKKTIVVSVANCQVNWHLNTANAHWRKVKKIIRCEFISTIVVFLLLLLLYEKNPRKPLSCWLLAVNSTGIYVQT